MENNKNVAEIIEDTKEEIKSLDIDFLTLAKDTVSLLGGIGAGCLTKDLVNAVIPEGLTGGKKLVRKVAGFGLSLAVSGVVKKALNDEITDWIDIYKNVKRVALGEKEENESESVSETVESCLNNIMPQEV